MRGLLSLPLVLSVLLPSVATAQSEPGACLDAASAALAETGAGPLGPPTSGFLLEGEARTLAVTLEADECIGVLAVGHLRVQDLDLTLHTDSGLELAADVTTEAYAWVRYCGAEGLRLVATVHMYKGQGEYAVALYRDAPATLPNLGRDVGACFAVSAGLASTPPDLGPEPIPSLETSMELTAARMREGGYRPEGPPVRGQLTRRSSAHTPLRLTAGSCYAVTVTGGEGTFDVDLSILGPDGRPLLEDEGPAREAALALCPSASGVYQAEVVMFEGNGPYLLQTWILDEPPSEDRPGPIAGQARIGWAQTLAALAARSFTPRPLHWGHVWSGGELSMPVPLTAGRCYALAAVPSEDLVGADLDLVLVDEAGSLVAWDVGGGANPIVYHCPTATQTYRALGRAYGGHGRYLLLIGEPR